MSYRLGIVTADIGIYNTSVVIWYCCQLIYYGS